VETKDQDMDIWISVKTPVPGREKKQIRLVVTPIKKSCSSSDAWWWPCKGSGQCVRRDLLCDGVLNCAGGDSEGDEQAEVCARRVFPAGGYFNLPLVLISAIGAVTGLILVLCCAKIAVCWVKRERHVDQTEGDNLSIGRLKSEDREVFVTPTAPPDEEFLKLPAFPPSYIEAVMGERNHIPRIYPD